MPEQVLSGPRVAAKMLAAGLEALGLDRKFFSIGLGVRDDEPVLYVYLMGATPGSGQKMLVDLLGPDGRINGVRVQMVTGARPVPALKLKLEVYDDKA